MFVDWNFECLITSARADGNLAESTGQLGKMGGTPKSKSSHPRSTRTWDAPYRIGCVVSSTEVCA